MEVVNQYHVELAPGNVRVSGILVAPQGEITFSFLGANKNWATERDASAEVRREELRRAAGRPRRCSLFFFVLLVNVFFLCFILLQKQ